MPLEIKCESCGFIFYKGSQLKSVDDVLKFFGYKCPVCLSPTRPIFRKYTVSVWGGRKS